MPSYRAFRQIKIRHIFIMQFGGYFVKFYSRQIFRPYGTYLGPSIFHGTETEYCYTHVPEVINLIVCIHALTDCCLSSIAQLYSIHFNKLCMVARSVYK